MLINTLSLAYVGASANTHFLFTLPTLDIYWAHITAISTFTGYFVL